MDPIQEIKARISVEELARDAGVILRQESNEFKGLCPFHNEDGPSFTIYEASDGYQKFKCFGCSAGGDLFDFYERWRGVDKGTAVRELAERARVELPERERTPSARPRGTALPAPISVAEGDLQRQADTLARHPDVLAFLQEQRRLTPELIRRAQLGYDAKTERVVIPLLDINGQNTRSRLYDWQKKHRGAKVIWGQGKEKPRLYPAWALQEQQLLLTAGEMDCLAAWSLGIPAITGTGGEGKWGRAFSEPLTGKRVTICYDLDPEGQEGAQKVATDLARHAAEVRILTLPLQWREKGDPKDLTDWVVAGGTAEQLRVLIAAAPVVPKPADSLEAEPEEQLVLDKLPGAPVGEDALLPARWIVNEKGVFEPTSRDGETRWRQVVATPVVITERIRNLDTDLEALKLAFMRDGRWRSLTAERDLVADKGRIVRLANKGLLVTSNNACQLVQYLAEYETTNLELIPEQTVISVSGWRRDPEADGRLFMVGKQLLSADLEDG